eukprot:CAMPEP_0170518906 /NCGR_PEP_ID=MMETSP0209-20121228/4499_1 /TAXON_ID=665100 ORGANISM="Litonotus pictus, Strain P1" /NCGR_SAMPLE_ID=MMETSP0209 /ASSEMBLY_ACC=CAM_ASM_000301 /LENGTH=856 /DNA_ID=CAMNT_0010804657 /DNA_START=161 /DNA_END=2731 /DNA_ORIENTATION=-
MVSKLTEENQRLLLDVYNVDSTNCFKINTQVANAIAQNVVTKAKDASAETSQELQNERKQGMGCCAAATELVNAEGTDATAPRESCTQLGEEIKPTMMGMAKGMKKSANLVKNVRFASLFYTKAIIEEFGFFDKEGCLKFVEPTEEDCTDIKDTYNMISYLNSLDESVLTQVNNCINQVALLDGCIDDSSLVMEAPAATNQAMTENNNLRLLQNPENGGEINADQLVDALDMIDNMNGLPTGNLNDLGEIAENQGPTGGMDGMGPKKKEIVTGSGCAPRFEPERDEELDKIFDLDNLDKLFTEGEQFKPQGEKKSKPQNTQGAQGSTMQGPQNTEGGMPNGDMQGPDNAEGGMPSGPAPANGDMQRPQNGEGGMPSGPAPANGEQQNNQQANNGANRFLQTPAEGEMQNNQPQFGSQPTNTQQNPAPSSNNMSGNQLQAGGSCQNKQGNPVRVSAESTDLMETYKLSLARDYDVNYQSFVDNFNVETCDFKGPKINPILHKLKINQSDVCQNQSKCSAEITTLNGGLSYTCHNSCLLSDLYSNMDQTKVQEFQSGEVATYANDRSVRIIIFSPLKNEDGTQSTLDSGMFILEEYTMTDGTKAQLCDFRTKNKNMGEQGQRASRQCLKDVGMGPGTPEKIEFDENGAGDLAGGLENLDIDQIIDMQPEGKGNFDLNKGTSGGNMCFPPIKGDCMDKLQDNMPNFDDEDSMPNPELDYLSEAFESTDKTIASDVCVAAMDILTTEDGKPPGPKHMRKGMRGFKEQAEQVAMRIRRRRLQEVYFREANEVDNIMRSVNIDSELDASINIDGATPTAVAGNTITNEIEKEVQAIESGSNSKYLGCSLFLISLLLITVLFN